MAASTSVEVEDGMAVVRQRTVVGDVEGAQRLRALADRLTEAAGPGVVRVVRAGSVPDGWELVTEHGGSPIDLVRLPDAASLVAVLALVAEVLAGLHGRGLFHGDLAATDIVIGADRRPRLCGFASSGGDGPADVGRLVAIGLELAAAMPADEHTARLQGLLVAANHPDPGRRPSARRLATDLGAVAGPPRSAGRGAAAERSTRPGPGPSRVAAVLIAAGLLAAVAILAVAHGRPPSAAAVRSSSSTAAPPTTLPSTIPPATTSTLPGCVGAAGRPSSPATACPRPLEVDGGAVVIDDGRWVVGRPGDVVLVGDWGCSGAPRAARLRPDTGEVLVYALPTGGGDPDVEQAERVPGASSLAAALDGSGCLALLVVTDGGTLRLT